MKSEFSRVLSSLRKEANLSQKEVSVKLEISQALLSHYEKGMREPGLAFVVRAANFYGVSCDYLLGRSLDKYGNAVSAEQILDTSLEKDNVLLGSANAVLQKKLIVNSISMLLDLVSRTKSKELMAEVSSYFYFPIYKTYRYILKQSSNEKTFSISEEYFESLCDAEQKVREVKIKALAKNDKQFTPIEGKIDLENLDNEILTKAYPKHAASLFSVVQSVSDSISVTTNPHTKTKPKKIKK